MTSSSSTTGITESGSADLSRFSIPALTGSATTYLNSGATGPSSQYILEEMRRADEQFSASYLQGARLFGLLGDLAGRARTSVAELLNAGPGEVALTQNTSNGISLAVAGIDWSAGDEVISTTAEHPGGLLPLYELRDRYGVEVRLIEPPVTPERIEAAMTDRTRLVSLSHVLYTDGAVVPLKEICALARSRNVLTLVDGAQSAGNIGIDVHDLGVDLYAVTGHKWLLGPEGMGALYVRPGVEAHTTNLGFATLSDPAAFDPSSGGPYWSGARRFEGSTINPALAAGLAAAANAANLRGPEQYDEIQSRADYLTRRLAALTDINIHSPRPAESGLVAFSVRGMESTQVVSELLQQDFVLRYVPQPYLYVRASTHLFNTTAELDALVNAVSRL